MYMLRLLGMLELYSLLGHGLGAMHCYGVKEEHYGYCGIILMRHESRNNVIILNIQ